LFSPVETPQEGQVRQLAPESAVQVRDDFRTYRLEEFGVVSMDFRLVRLQCVRPVHLNFDVMGPIKLQNHNGPSGADTEPSTETIS
jgi:hypothetical protein